jgi:FAD/FMN-containing dehydrogenase
MNIKTNGTWSILSQICGSKLVSMDPAILNQYAVDGSLFEGVAPIAVAWPKNTAMVQQIVGFARKNHASLLPVSSGFGNRVHGDSIPRMNDCVIVDLSKMRRIEKIDREHRVVAIEPGVTFEELLPELHKHGLRLNMPLAPRVGKSVITSALEREPIAMPLYQWDSTDPLLCTELVFGTGDVFRTGSAAGPGSIKEQRRAGQAQVNPMGPTQFNPIQVIQGAQGTLGIVTWATIKCEVLPTIQHLHVVSSDSLVELLATQHELMKFRLCDEIFIMNRLGLASLLGTGKASVESSARDLIPWHLVFVTSGHGVLPDDRVAYLDADVQEILAQHSDRIVMNERIFDEREILSKIASPSTDQWRSRAGGAHQSIFFLTGAEKIPAFVQLSEKLIIDHEIIVYIQPGNLGTSCHCEFDVAYDPDAPQDVMNVKSQLHDWEKAFIQAGAFFSRPYGDITSTVFQHYTAANITALKKVKAIFDPDNILNPGALCFGNVKDG